MLIDFSNFIFQRKWVYFLDKNSFSYHFLNLNFKNDKLSNL